MTHSITPETFQDWLSAMREAGLARSDAECARLLGVSANSALAFKQNGVKGSAALRTGLAMQALLNQLDPV